MIIMICSPAQFSPLSGAAADSPPVQLAPSVCSGPVPLSAVMGHRHVGAALIGRRAAIWPGREPPCGGEAARHQGRPPAARAHWTSTSAWFGEQRTRHPARSGASAVLAHHKTPDPSGNMRGMHQLGPRGERCRLPMDFPVHEVWSALRAWSQG